MMQHLSQCPVCDSKELEDLFNVTDHSVSAEAFNIMECSTCGLRITNPRPDAKEILPYYDSEVYISHSGTRKGLINRAYHLVRHRALRSKRKLVSKFAPDGPVLDIGCGTGDFLKELSNNGIAISGIEPDPQARERASLLTGIDILAPEDSHKLEKEHYRVVSMWHVLEHVHDLNEQVSQIKDLLLKGGVAIIAVPNPYSFDASHYKEFWAGYDVPRHLWHFSPKSVEKLFGKKGFELENRILMPFDSFYVSMLSEKYKKTSIGLLRGLLTGLRSFLAAKGNLEEASSIIYILKKT